MAFTEFCCRSGGSNLNAGTRTGNSTEPGTAAFKTYTSGTWVQATRTFTPAGGANPTTDGITVGDFVSIYPDAATVSPYVARITTVGSTTFVTDATAKAGTAPVDGVTNTSASIGGAWKGPNAASSFPFGFITNALTNVAGNYPRINFKSDATYSITAAMTHSATGPIWWQGYTTVYADGGKFTVDGGTTGASYILLTLSGLPVLKDAIFQNNGATGNAVGLNLTVGTFSICENVVVNSVRGSGFSVGSGVAFRMLIGCEAYACNQSNSTSIGGFNAVSGGATFIRCNSHDNVGNVADGFVDDTGVAGGTLYYQCISDSNGRYGFLTKDEFGAKHINCDAYNNGSDGIAINSSGSNTYAVYIENCNLVKNGGYGINILTVGLIAGEIANCGFGSGTQANTSGTTNNTGQLNIVGSVTYASGATPWVDPANGDFRINLAAAINAGRGTFTETQASYTGTIGYPDIGAAQHLESVKTYATSFVG